MKSSRLANRAALAVLTVAAALHTSLASGQTTSPAHDPIEGKWFGQVGFPQDRVDIGFEFKRNAKGAFDIYVSQPVMNLYNTQIAGDFKREGDTYSDAGLQFKVVLKEDVLTGTYFALHAPIELKRADKLPVEGPMPEFPAGPGPKWRVKLSAAIYAPAEIRNGVAYVGTSGGMFFAIRTKDGSFVWAFPAGRGVFGQARATDKHVYFVCDNGYLYKLDRANGKEAWKYDLGDAQVARMLPHQVAPNGGEFDFVTSSPQPVLVKDVLYVGSGDGSVHAVDAESGKRVWRTQLKGAVRANLTVDDTRVIAGGIDGSVCGLERDGGKVIWSKDTQGAITSSPTMIDGTLVVGNRNGLLAGMNPADGKVIWRLVIWGSAVESSPTPVGGSMFYIGSSDLRRTCYMDAKDGRVVWRTDVHGWAWAAPVVTETMIYQSTVGSKPYEIRHSGSLTALERKSGRIVWRWVMPEWPGAWQSGFVPSPGIDGGMLVVGGMDGALYGFAVEQSAG